MTEDEIRAVIRQVLAAKGLSPASAGKGLSPASAAPASPSHHCASGGRFGMLTATPVGSPCVIEPTVGCNQCGYCVSLGH